MGSAARERRPGHRARLESGRGWRGLHRRPGARRQGRDPRRPRRLRGGGPRSHPRGGDGGTCPRGSRLAGGGGGPERGDDRDAQARGRRGRLPSARRGHRPRGGPDGRLLRTAGAGSEDPRGPRGRFGVDRAAGRGRRRDAAGHRGGAGSRQRHHDSPALAGGPVDHRVARVSRASRRGRRPARGLDARRGPLPSRDESKELGSGSAAPERARAPSTRTGSASTSPRARPSPTGRARSGPAFACVLADRSSPASTSAQRSRSPATPTGTPRRMARSARFSAPRR